jgi:hypothetical protein
MSSLSITGAHVFAFGGTRALSGMGSARARSLATRIIQGGGALVVGCAKGADAAAIAAAGALAPSRVRVLAAFGPIAPSWPAPQARYSAPGACAASAVREVAEHRHAGGRVSWWAGGGPGVPLVARLSARTSAVIAAADGGLILLFGSPSSRGSLLAGRLAVARGLPVYAWALGFPPGQLPLLGPGRWVSGAGPLGLGACWVWRRA